MKILFLASTLRRPNPSWYMIIGKIDDLQNSIQAYDTNGEPMLITHFDTEKLSFGDNVFGKEA